MMTTQPTAEREWDTSNAARLKAYRLQFIRCDTLNCGCFTAHRDADRWFYACWAHRWA